MKMKKFTQIPNWIISNAQIPDSSFRTYSVLKSFKYGSNNPFPSQATLAKIRNKSKKSIIEHLKILRKLSLLSYKKRGFSSSNQYQFIGEENHIDDGEEFVTTKIKETSALNSQNLQSNNTEVNNTKINNLKGDNKNSFKRERELSLEEIKLVEKIVEWNTRSVFNTLLTERQVRFQVLHTVKKYGLEKVKLIFDRTANTTYPHPKDFWNEIKELKGVSQ